MAAGLTAAGARGGSGSGGGQRSSAFAGRLVGRGDASAVAVAVAIRAGPTVGERREPGGGRRSAAAGELRAAEARARSDGGGPARRSTPASA